MKTFKQLLEGIEQGVFDILNGIKGLSDNDATVEDDYIAVDLETSDEVHAVIDELPDSIDYEIMVISKDDESEEEAGEMEIDDIDDSKYDYVLIIYTDNAEYEEEMSEAVRKVKVNAKGMRRIKMKCKPGFKWDSAGRKCVKISGTEKLAKRKAIRKAIRTKKAMGAGAVRRANILRRKAKLKRKGMGLKT